MMSITNDQEVVLKLGKMCFMYATNLDMDKLIFEPSSVPEDKRKQIIQLLRTGKYTCSYGKTKTKIVINGVVLTKEDLLGKDEDSKNVTMTSQEMQTVITCLIKSHRDELGNDYCDAVLRRSTSVETDARLYKVLLNVISHINSICIAK